jgi:phage recombination protein Bet
MEKQMSNQLALLTNKLALELGMDQGEGLIETMKATAFKGQQVTNDQMIALMAVANQHKLNPWTNEIYAFPSKGAIIPVVGVDGWASIINRQPQFDGMEFEQDDESCTCTIYRKDRSHPIKTTEYMSECKRETQPWKSHPKRMLRHKALIQGARLAFGYTGFYDPDEAERIREIDMGKADQVRKDPTSVAQAAATVEHDETTLNLIADLELIAKEHGQEAYATSWTGLSKEQRKAIGAAKHEELKALAKPTVIDAETGEIA